MSRIHAHRHLRAPMMQPQRPAERPLLRRADRFERPTAGGPVLTPPVPAPVVPVASDPMRVSSSGALVSQAPASPQSSPPVQPQGLMTPRIPDEPYTRASTRAGQFPASLPGETLAQYALRTAPQTGFNTAVLGAFLSNASQVGGGPNTSFAELVDRFQNPTAYWSDAELSRQNMMRDRDIAEASKVYTGPVPVSSLTDDDKFYLYALSTTRPGAGNLHYEVLSGPRVDIARAINFVGSNNPADPRANNPALYTGPLRAIVEQFLAGKH